MKLRQSNTNRSVVTVSSVTALRRAVLLAGLCIGGAQTVALAQTERELESHEHGAASVNVVIDGASVFIELESPWNNLVGFEHSPSTENQHAAVDSALELLADPAAIFALNDAANCKVSSSSIENTMDSDAEHDEHEEHDDEHKEGHDDHAEHEEHDDDHKDEHDEHAEHEEHDDHADHGDEATHAEVLAMYSFECENPDKLESVNVTLFDLFTGFNEIAYQAAGPSGQVGYELTPSNTTLDLSEVR